jgi:hypothetical protein
MGIEKFNLEGVGMVAERVIDGRREKSCDGMVMACRSIGCSQLERVPTPAAHSQGLRAYLLPKKRNTMTSCSCTQSSCSYVLSGCI